MSETDEEVGEDGSGEQVRAGFGAPQRVYGYLHGWLVGLRNPNSPPYLRALAMGYRSYPPYRVPTENAGLAIRIPPIYPAHRPSAQEHPASDVAARRVVRAERSPIANWQQHSSARSPATRTSHHSCQRTPTERLADQSWGWPAAASSPAHDTIHRPIGAHVNLDHPRGIIYSL